MQSTLLGRGLQCAKATCRTSGVVPQVPCAHRSRPGQQLCSAHAGSVPTSSTSWGLNSRLFSQNSFEQDRGQKPAARNSNVRCAASSGASATDGNGTGAASLTPVLMAVAVSCAGAFAFGYHLGIVNGPLEQIALDLGFLGNKAYEGLVVSSTLAGAALGSLTGGGLSDALGRRKGFLLAALPMAVGPLLSATATGMQAMIAGRFLAGLAIGLSSALVPTYISEVAPTAVRGTLGALNQLCICFGILGALVVNVVLPPTAWKTMFALAVVPAAILAIGMLSCPESPRWLASKGYEASADAAAAKLWGPGGPAELRAAAGGDAGAAAAAGGGGLGDMFFGPSAKPVLIGVILFAFQQFAGINAIVYFSSSVFKQAGVTSGALASAAVGVTNVLGTLTAASLMDKAGRIQLLSNSFLGQAAAMFVMAAGFALPALQPYAGAIAVAGTLAYILSFALGAGPVPGLLVPELNPLRTRGKAVAAAFVSHWVCNVAVGQTFMGAVESYGLASVYVFFGVTALLGALYVRSQVPETKGKTLEQIEAELKLKA